MSAINCFKLNAINYLYLQAEMLDMKPQVKVRRTMSFMPSTKERPINLYK